jgi:hypothetical protein
VLAAVDLLEVNPSRATQSLHHRAPMPVPSKNEIEQLKEQIRTQGWVD